MTFLGICTVGTGQIATVSKQGRLTNKEADSGMEDSRGTVSTHSGAVVNVNKAQRGQSPIALYLRSQSASSLRRLSERHTC